MSRFYVSRISAHQFRNLESFSLDVHPRLNILFGNNGHGKTNIIEAVSLALSTKTLRPVKLTADLIMHGKAEGRAEVKLDGESRLEAAAHLFQKGKKHEWCKKALKDYAFLLERVAIVSFVPDELQIIHSSASLRRRTLNQIAAAIFPTYIGIFRRFEKALLSRNQLLKDPLCDLEELEAFNRVFADLAAEITMLRAQAVNLWTPHFLTSMQDIVKGSFQASASYAPSAAETSSVVLEKLRSCSREEGFRRVTLCGPHLDDLLFTINGADARFSASRGQSRAIVLALKIGKLNAIKSERKTPTILLLDDVTGELDPAKITHLLETVSELNVQTFLTTTHLGGLADVESDCGVFEVQNGQAHQKIIDS